MGDDDRIAAIAGWRIMLGGYVWFQFAAVRLDLQQLGHGHELLVHSIECILTEAKASGQESVIVESKIHSGNKASEAMCAAADFVLVSPDPDNHGLRLWRYTTMT